MSDERSRRSPSTQLERRRLLHHDRGLGVVLAPDQPEHLVALVGQEPGEVPAVLAGDAGDECALHAPAPPASVRSIRSHAGSSWWRNSAQRASSSASPMVAARRTQPVERAEEAAVGLVLPAHVARNPASPTAGAGRGHGGSRPGSTRTPRPGRGRADRAGPSRRGSEATAPPRRRRRRAGQGRGARAPRRGARPRRRARDRARSAGALRWTARSTGRSRGGG